MYKYIPKEGLKNLSHYKYSCNDKSLLAKYVMQPFWNQAINFLSKNLAPNLITLIGFGAILLSYGLTAYYSPTFSEPIPRWVHLFNALGLFFYQTMDALDGKQARRTKSSSPLGELFDHGCDAMTSVFMVLTICCTLRVGAEFSTLFSVLFMMLTFFHSQWEVYFTGSLDLWYVNVTEGQIMGMFMYILPFFLGVDTWAKHAITIFGKDITWGYMILLPNTIVTLVYLGISIKSMVGYSKGKDAKSLDKIVLYTLPAWFTVISWLVLYYRAPHLMTEHGHIFCLAPGFVLCKLVGAIVTARVCDVKYDIFYWVLVPIPLLIINTFTPFANDATLLTAYTVFTISAYIHFSICIIDEMTTYLGIKALSIPPQPKDDDEKKA